MLFPSTTGTSIVAKHETTITMEKKPKPGGLHNKQILSDYYSRPMQSTRDIEMRA